MEACTEVIYIWLRFVVCGWERLDFDDSRLAMRILRSAKVRATRAALTSARIHLVTLTPHERRLRMQRTTRVEQVSVRQPFPLSVSDLGQS